MNNAQLIQLIDARIDAKLAQFERKIAVHFADALRNNANAPNNMQLAKIKSEAIAETRKVINNEIKPILGDLIEKTTDGGELVTQFRHRTMGTGSQQQIAGGNKRAEFQASTFAFTDYD